MPLDEVTATTPLVIPPQPAITFDKWCPLQITITSQPNSPQMLSSAWQRGMQDDNGVWTVAPAVSPADKASNTARVIIDDMDAAFDALPDKVNAALEAILANTQRRLRDRIKSVVLQALQTVGVAQDIL